MHVSKNSMWQKILKNLIFWMKLNRLLALFSAVTRVSVRNGQKASFWHSSWIDGWPPASLCPRLYQHSKRKNRTVSEALLGGRWIRDIAYSLNHDLLRVLQALDSYRISSARLRWQPWGHHIMDSGEFRRILSQVSIHNSIRRASTIRPPNIDLESMGTAEVQILRMATTAR